MCIRDSSIRGSVRSAVALAQEHGFRSIALPLIGAGTGGGNEETVQALIEEELREAVLDGQALLVRLPLTRGRGSLRR